VSGIKRCQVSVFRCQGNGDLLFNFVPSAPFLLTPET
jgi:hypothetical protein